MSRSRVLLSIAVVAAVIAAAWALSRERASGDRDAGAGSVTSPTSAEGGPPARAPALARTRTGAPRPPATEGAATEAPPDGTRVRTGRVVERGTRTPIDGATLHADDDDDDYVVPIDAMLDLAARFALARTDAEGRFRLPFPESQGSMRVLVTHPSRASARTKLEAEGDGAFFDVELAAGATIEGEVRGIPPGWQGLPTIVVRTADTTERRVAAVTDGKFRVPGVTPGDVTVEARFRSTGDVGLVPVEAEVAVADGESARVVLRTQQGGALDVTVRRRGLLFADAIVEVWRGGRLPGPLESTVSGVYPFRGVPEGPVTVRARENGAVYFEATVEIVLDRTNTLTVDLPTGTVRGTVRVAGLDAPPRRVEVDLETMDGESTEYAWTKPDGSFAFTGLKPGKYRVVVGNPDSEEGDDEDDRAVVSIRSIERVIDVSSDAVTTVDFEVQRAGAVSVRVLDPDGKPLPGALVTVAAAGEATTWDLWFRAGGITGRDGTVRMHGLDDGRHVAHLVQSDLAVVESRPFDARAGTESETTITTRATGNVRVLIETLQPDGSVAFGCTLTLVDDRGIEIVLYTPHDPGKAYDLAIVPPGEYRLKVESERWKPVERVVKVAPPSPNVVRVVLEELDEPGKR